MTPEPSVPVAPPTGAAPADPRRRRGRPAHRSGPVPVGRVPVSKIRTAGFAASVLLLVAAVPTLGWVGVKLIRDSKAGKLVTRVSDPRAPGYEAIVAPTPTALLVHRDAAGALVGLTFLALGGSAGGGS